MNRHEAVLRELNMYPLWVRRDAVFVNSAQDIHSLNTPSPFVRKGEAENSTLSLALLPQDRKGLPQETRSQSALPVSCEGGGDESSKDSQFKATDKQLQINSNLNWPELKTAVRECTACKLRAGCTRTVFGVGDEKADWLFVGEGPGEEEDARGEPFVGPAGKLLDNMLLAIKLKRNNVYIANVVKCRPPIDESGRQLPPKQDEIAQCLPYMQRQIALLQPKVIVALGKVAANALLGNQSTLGSLRGTLHQYANTPLIVTYHPAYLLRSPSEKAKAWQDLCLAVETLQKQD